jgi:hypothetical protein
MVDAVVPFEVCLYCHADIFVDAKAFDNVPTKRLLSKLNYYALNTKP